MPEHGYPRFPTIHDDTVVFSQRRHRDSADKNQGSFSG